MTTADEILRPEYVTLDKEERKSQGVKLRDADFIGLEELKIADSVTASIKDITQRSLGTIRGIIQQDADLKVNIKRHFAAQENKQHKYSVVLHLEYSGKNISIDNVSGWDLEETVKMALNELEGRINHLVRSQGTGARDSAESHDREKRILEPAVQ